MLSSEHVNIEFKRSVYDTCDPVYLRKLREAAGVDLAVLARKACLSVAQVRELETDDSDELFYSDAIKRQAYKRLLMLLGAEPPSVEVPEELRDASKVAQAHLNTLDQIVAMSHQPAINRSFTDMVGSGVAKLKRHQHVMGASLLLIGAVGLFVWQGFQPAGDAVALTPTMEVAAQEPPSPAVAMASAPAVSASMAMAPAPVISSSAPTPVPVPVAAASVATSAVSLPAVAASSVANKVLGCAYVTDAMPELTTFIAQKEGRYVYVVSPINAEICVVDGNKQATLLQLKAGENRSVYGVSPWQVSSASLSKVQIFFQGGRVTMPDTATRVKLLEIPVSR